MHIKCKYCNNYIPLDLKIAAEEFEDEYREQIPNLQVQTPGDKSYDRHKDPLDWPLNYLDKGTKPYKWRTDVHPPIDDQQGVSNVAYRVNDMLLVNFSSLKILFLAFCC